MPTKQPQRNTGTRLGMGVDAQGGPVIDPTENVKILVEAQAKAEADLREADNRYYDLAIKSLKDSNESAHGHLKEMADLRASYQKNIRESDLAVAAQTRQVDVLAGDASSKTLATAVVTLQNTTDRNAETLRNQLNATAQTLAKQVSDTAQQQQTQTNAANAAMEKRISDLEKTSNTGAGRQGVAEPQLEKLTEVVAALAKAQDKGSGAKEGISTSAAVLMGVITIGSALMGGGAFLYNVVKQPNGTQATAPVTPPAVNNYYQSPPANPPK